MQLKNKIHLDIAMLLDIRAAKLLSFFPEFAATFIASPIYLKRMHDEFHYLDPRISTEKNTEMKSTSAIDLTLAKPTVFYDEVCERISEFVRLGNTTHTKYAVEVNVWPFQVAPDVTEFFIEALRESFGLSDVTLCSREFKNIQPSQLNELYAAVFVYDLNDWLVEHGNALLKKSCHSVDIITPLILRRTAQVTTFIDADYRKQMVIEDKQLSTILSITHIPLSDTNAL